MEKSSEWKGLMTVLVGTKIVALKDTVNGFHIKKCQCL